jgi:hypothetical protein
MNDRLRRSVLHGPCDPPFYLTWPDSLLIRISSEKLEVWYWGPVGSNVRAHFSVNGGIVALGMDKIIEVIKELVEDEA